MKKIMFAMILMAVSMVAMAGNGNGNHGSNGTNSNNVVAWSGNTDTYQYLNGVFSMKADGTMNIKLYQPASKNGQVVNDFGYYFVGDEDNKHSLVEKRTGNGKAVLTGNEEFAISDLKKDQKFVFYYTYNTGDKGTIVSTDKFEGGNDAFNPLYNDKKDVNYFTFGMPDTSWEAGGVLAFTADGELENDGTGRPLPGVLTTIILGGALVGGARKLRKRKNAAK